MSTPDDVNEAIEVAHKAFLIGQQPLRYVVPGLCLNLKNCWKEIGIH